MENNENVGRNNPRWARNDRKKTDQTKENYHLWKSNEPRQKRVALGKLSTNTDFSSFHARAKPPALPKVHERNAESSLEKTIKTSACSSSRQPFIIYVDQENGNVPWPCVDMAIYSTNSVTTNEPPTVAKTNHNSDQWQGYYEGEDIADLTNNSVSVTETAEYETEIHNYLKQAEQKHRPSRNFMSGQPLINKSMRAILVDWLVEVAEEYRLVPETLYLTINYIDRFLSSKVIIDPSKLQLVGVACMLIASKIEEIYPPEISEFVYITNSTYTSDQVKQMEKVVLKLLAFDLAVPTVWSFLDMYEKCVDLPEELTHKFSCLIRYYCEILLQDSDVQCTYLPSAVAASSIVLGLSSLGLESWCSTLAEKSGFELSDLCTCIRDMYRIVSKAADSNLQAIRIKYGESRFDSVANIIACKPKYF